MTMPIMQARILRQMAQYLAHIKSPLLEFVPEIVGAKTLRMLLIMLRLGLLDHQ